MFAALLAGMLTVSFTALPAVADTPVRAATVPRPTSTGRKLDHRPLLGRIILRDRSSTQKISADQCNSRAITLPQLGQTVGPNGASQSQTVLAVPIGGGPADIASATRARQLAEACSRLRR